MMSLDLHHRTPDMLNRTNGWQGWIKIRLDLAVVVIQENDSLDKYFPFTRSENGDFLRRQHSGLQLSPLVAWVESSRSILKIQSCEIIKSLIGLLRNSGDGILLNSRPLPRPSP